MTKTDDTYGLTLEDRQKLTAHNIKRLGFDVKDFNKDEMLRDIEIFLRKKQCLSLATVNPDGTPHQTILDYVSDGLDIYMASEGGDKFRNLELSKKVSLSIGYSDGTVESEYGLMIDGEAEIFKAPHPKFVAGMMKLKSFIRVWAEKIWPIENILSKAINTRLIIVKPFRMTYMNIKDGYPLYRWERDM